MKSMLLLPTIVAQSVATELCGQGTAMKWIDHRLVIVRKVTDANTHQAVACEKGIVKKKEEKNTQTSCHYSQGCNEEVGVTASLLTRLLALDLERLHARIKLTTIPTILCNQQEMTLIHGFSEANSFSEC